MFFRIHIKEKKTVREAATETVRQLQEIWLGKARIPVKPEQHYIKKLELLFQTWKDLKRLRNRKTAAQTNKVKLFRDSLDDLFDISHADALNLIKIKEDRDFLVAQQEKGRRGIFGIEDSVLAKKEQAAEKRRLQENKRKIDSVIECEASTSKVVFSSTTSSASDSQHDSSNDEEVIFPSLQKNPKIRKVSGAPRANVMTQNLAATLDRTQVSDRKAAMIITETVKSVQKDPLKLNTSRSSIRRERIRVRKSFAENLHKNFKKDVALTVHWDGKLKKTVDRIAILVSGQGVEQLLGVPSIPSGTGDAQADAVVKLVEQWGIAEKVAAICFDTTASNTGAERGACVLMEDKLEKNLIHLACRHHVLEIILAAGFKSALNTSSSRPHVALFKRFQAGIKLIKVPMIRPCRTM